MDAYNFAFSLFAIILGLSLVDHYMQHGWQVVGAVIAVRKLSPEGKVMTITDEGSNRKGVEFSQVLVFDRQ
jgi:hypothetical protein